MTRMDWRQNAACRGTDTELFFVSDARLIAKVARTYCAVCPVMDDCYAEALRFERSEQNINGVWAGLSASQRTKLHRARNRAAAIKRQA